MTRVIHSEKLAWLPNGMQICFISHGSDASLPVVLIAGLGLQLIYWPPMLIAKLVESGFQVICFDNRDAGKSTRCTTPSPSKLDLLFGRSPRGCYGIEDMAEDTAFLMAHLKLESAHVVGMSMGGMIAQALASIHPQRVRSLVSIFSTTGNRRVGQPSLSTKWLLATASAPRTPADAVSGFVTKMKHIGDPSSCGFEQYWASYAARAWLRNRERSDSQAFYRQVGAILKSGDRTEQLRQIRAPSLVVHGDIDRMVHPSGGVATAKAIPGARYEVLPGLRHQIDPGQADRLAGLLIPFFRDSPDGADCPSREN